MSNKKDLLEWQKCIFWLASHDGWYRPYELERKEVDMQFIGSEADTRLGELFGNLPNQGEVELDINGDKYILETKKDGAARKYRAYIKNKKPVAVHFVNIGGRLVDTREL